MLTDTTLRERRSGGPALTDEAIEQIRQMILSGDVKPGDRLPREADLAVQLGVSRNSLREAVRALTLVNVLDVRQGDGTYVTTLTPAVLLAGLDFIVGFHRSDSLLEFVQVRRILEPEAAAQAALHADADHLVALESAIARSDPHSSPEELLLLDVEFHRVIGLAAGNTVLAGLLEGLSAPTNTARLMRGRRQPGAQERTIAEHRAILDAVRAREPGVAHAAMLLHVAGVEMWLRDQAGEAPGPI